MNQIEKPVSAANRFQQWQPWLAPIAVWKNKAGTLA
jgi:hypothetical protein